MIKILSLAVVCSTLLLSACQQSAEQNPTPPAPTTAVASSESSASSELSASSASAESLSSKIEAGYLQGFREGFVKEGVASCMKTANIGEKSRQPCECSVNKLNASLTDEEAIEMGKGREPKDWQQRVEQAFNECTEK